MLVLCDNVEFHEGHEFFEDASLKNFTEFSRADWSISY